jgi:glycosyltransferase involved in cell wall biosynthesis
VENTSTHRTIRIAKARNVCLEKLETLDVEIHFMIDADDVNTEPWNLTLLKHYLSRKDWDALSFHRKDYYDIWALMYPPFKHHCWGFKQFCPQVVQFMKRDITKKLEKCNDLLECDSAFNGFAIYRTSVFNGLRYNGEYANLRTLISDGDRKKTLDALTPLGLPLTIHETFVQSCEHLYYHLSAKKRKARICISPYYI